MKRRLLAAFLALAALPAAAAVPSLLDDELRISRDLQTRLQAALDHILGEKKATVLVNVRLRLSAEMQARLDEALERPGPAAPSPAMTETTRYLYPSAADPAPPQVLPGFSARAQREQAPAAPMLINVAPPTASWDPAVILAAGVEVEKIFIKVLVDKRLSATADETVRAVVTNFVGLTPARGDVFELTRVRMPTIFEEAVQNPALMSPLLQKAATLTVVMLTAMCFFVLGLAALSTMRRSADHLASAVRNIGSLGGPGAFPGEGKPLLVEVEQRPAAALPHRPAEPAFEDVVFDVPADKVSYLLEMLAEEEIGRVALVLHHLTPAAKGAFMAQLSPDQAGELVMAMNQRATATPELLRELKEKVERHVRGSTGGVSAVVDMLSAAAPAMRRQLLEAIAKKDPPLGAQVRERIFFFEDLSRLSQEELSRVIAQVQLHDLALAVAKEPEAFKGRVRAVLPKLSWQVLSEEIEHLQRNASADKVGEAQDRVVNVVYKQLREGHIAPSFIRLPGARPGGK